MRPGTEPMTDRREEPANPDSVWEDIYGDDSQLQRVAIHAIEPGGVCWCGHPEREALPAPLDVERVEHVLFDVFPDDDATTTLIFEALARLSAQPSTEPAQGEER